MVYDPTFVPQPTHDDWMIPFILFFVLLFAMACANAIGWRPKSALGMGARDWFLAHLILGPAIVADKANVCIPYLICLEAVIAAAFVWRWARDRKQDGS